MKAGTSWNFLMPREQGITLGTAQPQGDAARLLPL